MPLRAASHEKASFVARQSLISISFLLAPCQPFHGMQRDIPEFFNRLLGDSRFLFSFETSMQVKDYVEGDFAGISEWIASHV